MEQKPAELSSFDAGVMCALAAIRIALQSTPGFNMTALEDAVRFFANTRQPGADKTAFELPLQAVGSNHANVVEAMMQGVGDGAKKPDR